MDLSVFWSVEKACITYYIINNSAGYKMEYPYAFIKDITLVVGESKRAGGLLIELVRPPLFFMDSSGSGGFYQCGDFTEDRQASRILVHYLGGYRKLLRDQLAILKSQKLFQNRRCNYWSEDLTIPVSPIMDAAWPERSPTAILGTEIAPELRAMYDDLPSVSDVMKSPVLPGQQQELPYVAREMRPQKPKQYIFANATPSDY